MSNNVELASWRLKWNRNLVRFLGSRVRGVMNVEDLAQETYLRLLRAPDLREVRNPQAYLIRVASHVVAEWRQNQPDGQPLIALDIDSLVDECSPDFQADADAAQERLETALASAAPMMRAVLLLRLRDGVAYRDIGKSLGLTERQVKRQLTRGYEYLRKALEVSKDAVR